MRARANAARRSRSHPPTRRARGQGIDIGPTVVEVVFTGVRKNKGLHEGSPESCGTVFPPNLYSMALGIHDQSGLSLRPTIVRGLHHDRESVPARLRPGGVELASDPQDRLPPEVTAGGAQEKGTIRSRPGPSAGAVAQHDVTEREPRPRSVADGNSGSCRASPAESGCCFGEPCI